MARPKTFADGQPLTAADINTYLYTPVPAVGNPVWMEGDYRTTDAPTPGTGITVSDFGWKRMGPVVMFYATWAGTIDVPVSGNITNITLFTLPSACPEPVRGGTAVITTAETGPMASMGLNASKAVRLAAMVPNATQTGTVATPVTISITGMYFAA